MTKFGLTPAKYDGVIKAAAAVARGRVRLAEAIHEAIPKDDREAFAECAKALSEAGFDDWSASDLRDLWLVQDVFPPEWGSWVSVKRKNIGSVAVSWVTLRDAAHSPEHARLLVDVVTNVGRARYVDVFGRHAQPVNHGGLPPRPTTRDTMPEVYAIAQAMRAEGSLPHQIASRLNEMGHTTVNGKSWNAQRTGTMLRSAERRSHDEVRRANSAAQTSRYRVKRWDEGYRHAEYGLRRMIQHIDEATRDDAMKKVSTLDEMIGQLAAAVIEKKREVE